MSKTSTESGPAVASFASAGKISAERGPDWLRRARTASWSRFEQLGFPTTRIEQWRNTNVSPIAATPFRPAPTREAGDFAVSDAAGPDALRLVFVNGRFDADRSDCRGAEDGVWLGDLETALETIPDRVRPLLLRASADQTPAFRALNTACHEDGAVVILPDGVACERPIHLLYLARPSDEPSAAHPRTLIVAGRSSHARIVESYCGPADGVYLTNAVTEIEVGDNATVEHCRLQLEGDAAYHLSTSDVRQGADSTFRSVNVNLGGKLVRNEIHAAVAGQGAECVLDGLTFTHASQHIDNQTVIDHSSPRCASRELYKGILADRSRTVFNGRIVVRQDAQKIDARQSNPNLLLSGDALAHTRPQLEIHADDVRCTHGATVGMLDEDAVFYLRSRGIGHDEARRLLVSSFAGEVLERVKVDHVRRFLEHEVFQRLAACDPRGGR